MEATSKIELAVTLEEAKDHGWVASAPEVRATAQGATEAEALQNLLDLLGTYPELLEEVRGGGSRRIELIAV
jgi:predicted RNase H-like HicB family nuclease